MTLSVAPGPGCCDRKDFETGYRTEWGGKRTVNLLPA